MKENVAPAPLATAMIIDDDPAFRAGLQSRLEEWGRLHDLGLLARAFDSPSAIEDAGDVALPDILFLDIMMPSAGRAGMDYARRLRRIGYAGRIVFVSSSPSFSLEAFDVEAVDYLLKPVADERLDLCLRRIAASLKREGSSLVFHTARGWARFRAADIVSLRSARNCVEIRTVSGPVRALETFHSALERLPDEFVQCRRTDAVNMRFVKAVSPDEIRMFDAERVPVSRSFRKQVFEAFRRQAGTPPE